MVSTHSRPKAAGFGNLGHTDSARVSTHSRPKAAGGFFMGGRMNDLVSTHSRPKAAGKYHLKISAWWFCFNTQPPEGGWAPARFDRRRLGGFQHTAARRRLGYQYRRQGHQGRVSTHSRPKAAGRERGERIFRLYCFNTQPPEGGWVEAAKRLIVVMAFQHTAARRRLGRGEAVNAALSVSTHSRPKAAGPVSSAQSRR